MQLEMQKGYTLIEIMMAVAIVAIIAALAVPYYNGFIAEGRISTAVKDIRQMEVLMDDLALDNDLVALDSDVNASRGVYTVSSRITLDSPSTTPAGATPYLDPWGNVYLYRRDTATNNGVRIDGGGTNVSNDNAESPAPQAYDLFSVGADGSAGTGDDVVRGCNGTFAGLAGDEPDCWP